ncbi:MAG TPA: hypothetical protein VFW65_30010 [Pseudonocardiaceae bacterium]|nr:hypothetical protein [Pseudonocardiaceae bacterium]
MSEDPTTAGSGESGVWSLPRFAEELRELKRRAGAPSLSDIRKRTRDKPAIATIHVLLAGRAKRAPRWDLVSDVVAAMATYARERDLELDAREADLSEWRRRHGLLVQAMERAAAHQAARLETLLADFSVLPADQIRRPPFHTLGELIAGWEGRPKPVGGAYLPRPDFDEELRAALAAPSAPYPFILVYGDDGAGKSTSAWTAVMEILGPETKVLIPRDGTAIAALAEADDASTIMTGPLLIWADGLTSSDLERITRETLDLLADTTFLVATISADECAAILDSPRDLMPTARAALTRAYLIHLPYDPEIAEQTTSAKDIDVAPAIPDVDPRLVWLRLNTAHSKSPEGVAIVRSVIDCRRAGLTRPVSEDELKQLFPIYLAEIDDLPISDELFAAGMEWAQKSGPATLPMLRPRRYRGHPSWGISDQLREDQATWKIPASLWPQLIKMLDPQECFHVAREAEKRGDLVYATGALAKAATLAENTARANVLLGGLFGRLGDTAAAKTALMTVIDLGLSEEASAAANLLARMLKEEGNVERAIEYWTLATQWPGTFALLSWFELGQHYASVGDREKAVAALSRNFSEALPGIEIRASTLLSFVQGSIGDLHTLLEAWETNGDYGWENHGDAVSAVREFVEIAESTTESEYHPESSDPDDMDIFLADGRRLLKLGDFRGALEVFRSVAASGQLDLRAAALCEAGSTAMEMGLLVEAREAYEASIRCAHPDYSAHAALQLGGLLWEENHDASGAIRAWTSAAQLGDPETQAKATFNIGIAHHDAHEYRAAISKFQHAMRLADSHFQAKILMMLAETHQAIGAEASIIDDYYRQALGIDDPHYSPIAAVALGKRMYDRDGPSAEALRVTRIGYGSQNLEARAEAAWRLGHMLEERGEIDEAIAAYRTAIDTDHSDWAPCGHCALGLLYGIQNKTSMGMRHLQAAYNSGHPEYRMEAAYWIGMFYWWDGTHGKEGALQNAVIMLRQVVDSRNRKWWPEAGIALASILEDLGDLESAIVTWRQLASSGIEPHATRARTQLAEHGKSDAG